MAQLPGPRKRRAAQAVSPLEALHKRVKEAQPSLPLQQQDMYPSVLAELMPLGLRLRKSTSLVNLVQMALSQAKSSAGGQSAMDNNMPEPHIMKETKCVAQVGERLKASNFTASSLKIGTWEYTSQYEGDLVVKCYYGKHKLVWEVLDNGLKSKIEIQWAHIIALKATCPEKGDGTLDLVLDRAPLFFKEIGRPEPRKHTLWQATSDFTGGQASLHRRQILQCPSTLLRKNFEKLILCDQRLNQLSQQTNIILDSLIFEPRSSIFERPNESDASLRKVTHPVSPCAVSKDGVKNLILQQPEFFAQPVNFGNCMTEQRIASNEAPSKEFLDIAQCLLSVTHDPPTSDEKYLMARVDSLYNLLETDTVAGNTSMPEHNEGGSIVVGEVDSDDFDAELRFCFENEELRLAP